MVDRHVFDRVLDLIAWPDHEWPATGLDGHTVHDHAVESTRDRYCTLRLTEVVLARHDNTALVVHASAHEVQGMQFAIAVRLVLNRVHHRPPFHYRTIASSVYSPKTSFTSRVELIYKIN